MIFNLFLSRFLADDSYFFLSVKVSLRLTAFDLDNEKKIAIHQPDRAFKKKKNHCFVLPMWVNKVLPMFPIAQKRLL